MTDSKVWSVNNPNIFAFIRWESQGETGNVGSREWGMTCSQNPELNKHLFNPLILKVIIFFPNLFQGVKIYDISTKQRITNVLRDNVSLRPDMYPCSLCWKDNTTLIVGWGTSIKVGTNSQVITVSVSSRLSDCLLFYYFSPDLCCERAKPYWNERSAESLRGDRYKYTEMGIRLLILPCAKFQSLHKIKPQREATAVKQKRKLDKMLHLPNFMFSTEAP